MKNLFDYVKLDWDNTPRAEILRITRNFSLLKKESVEVRLGDEYFVYNNGALEDYTFLPLEHEIEVRL